MSAAGRAAGCTLLAAAIMMGSLVGRVPAKAGSLTNPLAGNEEAQRAGAKLYARECAECHGRDRNGVGKAPALSAMEVAASPPGVLFWILRNGSLRRGMPSFAHLPEPQRWQIITYLQAPAQTGQRRMN